MSKVLLSPARFAAAGAAVVAALVHGVVLEDHLQKAPYLGVAFVLYILICAVLAVLLVRRDSAWVWSATGALGLAAIGAYALSRSAGLPQVRGGLGSWTDPAGLLAITAELTMTGSAAFAFWWHRYGQASERRTRALAPWAASAVVVALGIATVGAVTTGTAAGGASASGGMSMTDVTDWNNMGAAFSTNGTTRTYYISADEVTWNYAPLGYNGTTGQPFDEEADTFVKSGPGRIGSKYYKCLYRGYTNDSFSTLVPRSADDQYLGLLGPVIRGVVGDTIRVVFRNTCSIPTSVHPHGVFYTKNAEGAPYSDGTSGSDKYDDAVPTGGRHTYVWQVPERAGPGPHDGTSVMWMYHSHTDEIGDTYAGLMGPMVITKAGSARADGSPNDVDREIFGLFSVMDENKSPYLERSLEAFAGQPYPDLDDEGFNESNLMHSINGYVYGSMPMVKLRRGQHVRWYEMSMGTEVDLHTPHWHGNTVTVGGMRMDVVNLLPASMAVADMVPDATGVWLYHCHVNDHISAGMMARYQVTS
ncbi:multicopper oxidase domain-containing protein [Sphaerisporangium sp. NPDC051011]|uniref:multicopper oxidase domain-containing protein n=1 Tax=Sphaerisporangium sp. NPDC051011 TaxID=3155792 RepID=UPI0033DE2951